MKTDSHLTMEFGRRLSSVDVLAYHRQDGFYERLVQYLRNTVFPNVVVAPEPESEPDELEQFIRMREVMMRELFNILENLSDLVPLNGGSWSPKELSLSDWFAGSDKIPENAWADQEWNPVPPNSERTSQKFPISNGSLIGHAIAAATKVSLFCGELLLGDLLDLRHKRDFVESKLADESLSHVERQRFVALQSIVKMTIEFKERDIQKFNGINKVVLDLFSPFMLSDAIAGMPTEVLGIFATSLEFNDRDSLELVAELLNRDWLPANYRVSWLRHIVRQETPVNGFSPQADKLVADFLQLFFQGKKNSYDPDIRRDTWMIVGTLYGLSLKAETELTLGTAFAKTEELVTFVSALLDLISDQTEDEIVNLGLRLSFRVLDKCPEALSSGSYLLFYLVRTLLGFLPREGLELEIWYCLEGQRLAPVYLGNLSDGQQICLLRKRLAHLLSAEFLDGAERWQRLFQKMSIYEGADELTDVITSCQVVCPALLETSAEPVLVDSHAMATYLWANPVNPLTRKELSLAEFRRYNEDHVDEVSKWRQKLRDFIQRAKIN
ncbi:MAG: hypothetical protein ACYCOU_10100 [Sulfobacillus sp.]